MSMMSSSGSVSDSQGHTEGSVSADSETDPLLDLDDALSRYLQRMTGGEVDEDADAPKRQQSAILMLGNLKSSDELSVKSRSAPPSRGQQRRGAYSKEKRALGELTDAEYETFLADLREEAKELAAARAEAAAKKPDDENSDEGGTLSEFWDSSNGSQQSGSSLYDPAAEAAKEYKVEELDITLVHTSGQLHWSDEDNSGIDFDWASDPLIIEEVEEGSTGEQCGLRNEDEIIRVNGFNIREVGEERFTEMLKCLPITLTVVRRTRIGTPQSSTRSESPRSDTVPAIYCSAASGNLGGMKSAEIQLEELSNFQQLIDELRGVLPSRTIEGIKSQLSRLHDHLISLRTQLVDATASINGMHKQFEENILAEIQRIKIESSEAKTATLGAAENLPEEKDPKRTETVVMPGGGSVKALNSSRLVDTINPTSLSSSYEPLVTDV